MYRVYNKINKKNLILYKLQNKSNKHIKERKLCSSQNNNKMSI